MSEKLYTREELTGRAPSAAMSILAITGLLGIAVGTMLPMIGVLTAGAVAWWKYVYAAGAACYLVAKFFTPYTGSHPRVKRLMRIESWSAIFFCVVSVFHILQRRCDTRRLGLYPGRRGAADIHLAEHTAHHQQGAAPLAGS